MHRRNESSHESSASLRVADALRTAILRAELTPGTPLREVDLARAHGAGRYTVKSALQQLAAERLVQHDPHRGARVRVLTAGDLTDLFALRRLLEFGAIDLIVERNSSLDLVEASLARLEAFELPGRTVTPELMAASLDEDLAFHRALVEAARSARLRDAYAAIEGEVRFAFTGWQSARERELPIASEHRAIAQALRAHDVAQAKALLAAHLAEAHEQLLQALVRPTGDAAGAQAAV